MCFLNNVLFFSCAAILSLGGISADGDGAVSPAEQHADGLMLDARLAVWELLENENARKVISGFFEDVKQINEDATAANMMIGVTKQIMDTLTDKNRGAVSVKYLVDAIRDWSIEPNYTSTIEALYKAAHRTIVNPYASKWLDKCFDFFDACVETHRGADLVMALTNGNIKVIQKPNVRENIKQAFRNGKALISTSLKRKISDFVVKG